MHRHTHRQRDLHRPFDPPRYMQVIGTALLAFLLSGCGTTGPTASYDASRNRMTYESAEMPVAELDAAVGSGSSIVMRAVASCRGPDCTPETVRFVFAVEGPGQSAMADHSVSIVANGTEYSWSGERNWERQGDITFSQGAFVRVGLSLSEVEQIATATSISGYLGGTPLTLGGQVQSKLRNFVGTIRSPSASTSS